ncbi:MAG: right-handed parallel beta-helix repeat-containing protein, partial [Verrucomicrobiota bacterium]
MSSFTHGKGTFRVALISLFIPILHGVAFAIPDIRWEDSTSRIYVSGDGLVTLPMIAEVPGIPLETSGEAGEVWTLGASIFLQEGATLEIRNVAAGGAVDELRMVSNASLVTSIEADRGTVFIEGTTVTSWDPDTSQPDTELKDGRAFLLARSRSVSGMAETSSMILTGATLQFLGSRVLDEAALVWDRTHFDEGVSGHGGLENCRLEHCAFAAAEWSADSLAFNGNEFHECEILYYDPNQPVQVAIHSEQVVPFSGNVLSPAPASMRWANSSRRIYVGPGSATLTDIRDGLPLAPIEEVSPGVWHLKADLIVENGGVLVLRGRAAGGDVDELRLQSNNVELPDAVVSISADWGTIKLDHTRVLSWDDAVNGPDEEFEEFGRAFVRVRSRLDKIDGVTPRESRMDIHDCEIAYLGSQASEAYGLSWKVLGFDGVDGTIFEQVEVFGNIKRTAIHHLHYGVYTYGATGCVWEENELYDNTIYGFDPHDDSDNLWIVGNDVHDNGSHGIIASKRCDQVRIVRNRTYRNDKVGIMLHRDSNFGIIENNDAFENLDSGIAIFASSDVIIRDNRVERNEGSGVRFSVGARDCLFYGNLVADSGDSGVAMFFGSNPPNPGDDGHPKRNQIGAYVDRDYDGQVELVGNRIINSGKEAFRLVQSDENIIRGNVFENNSLGIEGVPSWRFDSSLGNVIESNNTFPAEVLVKLQDGFSGSLLIIDGDVAADVLNVVADENTEVVYRLTPVEEPEGERIFLEKDGRVVMEAENYSTLENRGSHAWIEEADQGGFSGRGAMFAGPNTRDKIDTNIETSSPELAYRFRVEVSGPRYLWVRAWSATTSDDSAFFGLDGQFERSIGFVPGVWAWKRKTIEQVEA